MKKGTLLALVLCVTTMFFAGCGGEKEPSYDRKNFVGTWVSEFNETDVLEVKNDGTMILHRTTEDIDYEWHESEDKEYDIEYGSEPSNWKETNLLISEDGTTLYWEKGFWGTETFGEGDGELWYKKGEKIERGEDVIKFEIEEFRVKEGNKLVASGTMTNNGKGTYGRVHVGWAMRDKNNNNIFFLDDDVIDVDEKPIKPNETRQFELVAYMNDSGEITNQRIGDDCDVEEIKSCVVYITNYLRY